MSWERFLYIRINVPDSDLIVGGGEGCIGIYKKKKVSYDSAAKPGLETFTLVKIRIL